MQNKRQKIGLSACVRVCSDFCRLHTRTVTTIVYDCYLHWQICVSIRFVCRMARRLGIFENFNFVAPQHVCGGASGTLYAQALCPHLTAAASQERFQIVHEIDGNGQFFGKLTILPGLSLFSGFVCPFIGMRATHTDRYRWQWVRALHYVFAWTLAWSYVQCDILPNPAVQFPFWPVLIREHSKYKQTAWGWCNSLTQSVCCLMLDGATAV